MRYGRGSRWREALAECPRGCGMWQVRYFDGLPTSEPYQVRVKAQKAARGSWRLSNRRLAAINAVYGSVQMFLDSAPLVCMSMQDKR